MVGTLTTAESVTAGHRVNADELCRLHAADVCRFAAMMSSSSADAEDLAQEALLRAVRSLHSYDPAKGTVGAWLWRIVANAAKDAATRRQRMRDLVVRIGLLTPRESETVEDAAMSRIGDPELRAQLNALPLRDRTLLALRYGAGLDARGVAAAVGLNPESTGRATRRALARLRARLKEVNS